MDLLDVIHEAARTAYYTLVYLWSYAFSIVWAFVGSAAFQALFQENRFRVNILESRSFQRVGSAIVLGLLYSPWRKNIANNIKWLVISTGALELIPFYLVAACNLTIYYWLLLGPLLGKEFLLLNLFGAILFLLVTCPMFLLILKSPRLQGGDRGPAVSPADEPFGCAQDKLSDEAISAIPPFARRGKGGILWRFVKKLVREVTRIGPWVLGGALLGGFIAVWGLSSWWFDLSQIGGTKTWLSQLINALMGLGFAVATLSMPVANLFVATYLWKTGMALSGFMAYLYGPLISPLLWPAYIQTLGRRKAFYVLCVLAVGVIAASLGTTAIWKLFGLDIHYKLSPNQLL